jgi:hypothetical protein
MTATVSGPAAHEAGLAPLFVDGLDLVLGVDHRLLRAHLARAARANMFGMMNVERISPTAVFAGPGCPMLTLHLVASLRKASLFAGLPPNGSFSSHLFRFGVSLSQAQKS